ncbi:MAG: FAD-binding protein, partial [Xanthomonadaceae bacterium]|nr:FAD-binding protein [Xanthomonadaceae bacterium]
MSAQPATTPISPARRQELIRALGGVLPPAALLTETEALRPYECDGLSAYRHLPMLVVLPETLEQAQAVLRICREQQVPVVTRGAGTGLSGGALPLANGVLMGMARFNR